MSRRNSGVLLSCFTAALIVSHGEVRALPDCEKTPQPPICQCRGLTGEAQKKCYCDANPELEQCVESPAVSGTVRPRYLILTIAYSPPGAATGGARSSVAYSTGSTTGTAISLDGSFKSEVEMSATSSFLGLLEVGVSGGYSSSVSDGKVMEIKKSTTDTITVQGGSTNGVNHDLDLFYLWLNPKLAFVARDNRAQWTLGSEKPAMRVQVVSVGQLKNPSTIPPGVLAELNAAGIRPEDYAEILAQNPFARGGTTIDPNRYHQTDLIYPYEPPFEQGSPPPTWQSQMKNSTITGSSSTHTRSYSVGFSVTAGPFSGWFGTKIKTSTKFTWTNTSKWSTSNDQSQTATLTVGSPSFGYTGPTAMAVYWDALYGSFMFVPSTPGQPSVAGRMTDPAGKPMANKEVSLLVGRKQWRTFTNAKGEYKFYGTPQGVGFVEIVGAPRQRITLPPTRLDLPVIRRPQ